MAAETHPSGSSSATKRRTMRVPAAWQLDDAVADVPAYTNIQYPIEVRVEPQVRVPRRNPTAVYRKTVKDLDASARRCVLHVGAADNAAFVRAGGRWLAFWKDARAPAEVDVTDAVAWDGTLDLVVVVVRWSDGAYLEDQDAWKLSGLIRDCYLLFPPLDEPFVFDLAWRLFVCEDDDHRRSSPSRSTSSGRRQARSTGPRRRFECASRPSSSASCPSRGATRATASREARRQIGASSKQPTPYETRSATTTTTSLLLIPGGSVRGFPRVPGSHGVPSGRTSTPWPRRSSGAPMMMSSTSRSARFGRGVLRRAPRDRHLAARRRPQTQRRAVVRRGREPPRDGALDRRVGAHGRRDRGRRRVAEARQLQRSAHGALPARAGVLGGVRPRGALPNVETHGIDPPDRLADTPAWLEAHLCRVESLLCTIARSVCLGKTP